MQLLATCLVVGIAATEVPEDLQVSLWSLAENEVIVAFDDFAVIAEAATREKVFVGRRSFSDGYDLEITLSSDRRNLFLRGRENGELVYVDFFTCEPE